MSGPLKSRIRQTDAADRRLVDRWWDRLWRALVGKITTADDDIDPATNGAGGSGPPSIGGEDDGCSCTVVRPRTGAGWFGLFALAQLLALTRRRSRRVAGKC